MILKTIGLIYFDGSFDIEEIKKPFSKRKA